MALHYQEIPDDQLISARLGVTIQEARILLKAYSVDQLLQGVPVLTTGAGSVKTACVGSDYQDFKVACAAMEAQIPEGGKVEVDLCTEALPTDEDLADLYIRMIADGIDAEYPRAVMVDGVPTTTLILRKSSPFLLALVPILPTLFIVGLIAFGIANIGNITSSLMPIIVTVVVGAVVLSIGIAVFLAKPAERVATAYLKGGQQYLPRNLSRRDYFMKDCLKTGNMKDCANKYNQMLLKPGQEFLPSTVPVETKDDGSFFAQTELRDKVRELWIKACEWQGVPPISKFVVFSEDNPYKQQYEEAIGKLLRSEQLRHGLFQPATVAESKGDLPAMLRFLMTASGKNLTEARLRQQFGDAVFELALGNDFITGSQEPDTLKRQMHISTKGRAYLFGVTMGKKYVMFMSGPQAGSLVEVGSWIREKADLEKKNMALPVVKYIPETAEKDRYLPFSGMYTEGGGSILRWAGKLPDMSLEVKVKGFEDRPKLIIEAAFKSSSAIIHSDLLDKKSLPVVTSLDLPFSGAQDGDIWWMMHHDSLPVEVQVTDIDMLGELALTDIFNGSTARITAYGSKSEGKTKKIMYEGKEVEVEEVQMFCMRCGKEVPKPSEFRSPESLRTYMITGMCQACQDREKQEKYFKKNPPSTYSTQVYEKPFVRIGERVTFLPTGRGAFRYNNWPEGVWLGDKEVNGTVKEFHKGEPKVTIGDKTFEYISPWAVVQWNNGAETSIDAEDEGVRWKRRGIETPALDKQMLQTEGERYDVDFAQRLHGELMKELRDPTVLKEKMAMAKDLQSSIGEEKAAQAAYTKRGIAALNYGDAKTGRLYEHIIDEERHHEQEFTERFKEIGGEKLTFNADSSEYVAQTIEDIGWRERLDTAFLEAVERVKK